MPLIDLVGRKTWRTRIIFAAMYLALSVGGITMVYPFMVMVTSAMTSTVDYNDFSPSPRYVFDEESLYRKFVHEKYNSGYRGSLPTINRQYGRTLLQNKELELPHVDPAILTRVTDDWHHVQSQLPSSQLACGFSKSGYEVGRAQIQYQQSLERQFGGDIHAFNRRFLMAAQDFTTIYGPEDQPLNPTWLPEHTEFAENWRRFVRENLPDYFRFVPNCDGLWQEFLADHARNSIDAINRELNAHALNFGQFMLPASYHDAGPAGQLWLRFVTTRLPMRYVTLGPEAAHAYRRFLATLYESIEQLNAAHDSKWASFDTVIPPVDFAEEHNPRIVRDIRQFLLASPLIAQQVTATTPENRYRDFLRQRYGSVEQLNTSYQTMYLSIADVPAPHALTDLRELRENRGDWRWHFLSKNFSQVFGFITRQNGAMVNTLLLCAAMILATLTVNPLCAYALSRFKLSYTNSILIFLLATMAFPAEVAMIPNFLLLRDLNLLNTYAALILPGVANGFSIFLLKGFFDSLPEEIFEAATIDGAGEIRIFAQISMPLCKPVLAYMALGAFTGAYQAFLFAMIVCPEPNRWTIMVFLYDMGNWTTPSMQMAGMVLASIPTLLVFVLAQRVIMRGIVIPIEK